MRDEFEPLLDALADARTPSELGTSREVELKMLESYVFQFTDTIRTQRGFGLMVGVGEFLERLGKFRENAIANTSACGMRFDAQNLANFSAETVHQTLKRRFDLVGGVVNIPGVPEALRLVMEDVDDGYRRIMDIADAASKIDKSHGRYSIGSE